MTSIVTGSANTLSSKDCWVVGHFKPPGLAHSRQFEVKVWRYHAQPDYGQKKFTGTEFIIVEGGELTLELQSDDGENRKIVLKGVQRQYVIIPPNYQKRFWLQGHQPGE